MKLAAISLILAVGSGLISIGSSGRSAAAPDPSQLFDALVQALNADDVSAAVALFAEDAVLVAGGPGPGGPCPGGRCADKAAISRQLEGQVRGEHDFRALASQTSTNKLSGRYELRSARRALDIPRIIFTFDLEETDGKISLFSFQPDLTDAFTASFIAQRPTPPPVRPPATGDAGLAARR